MSRASSVLVSTVLASAALLAPAAIAHAQAPAAEQVRTVTYRGPGATVTLDHLDRISRTGRPFQRFVGRELKRLWKANDPRPECRAAATIVVKTWRSDGYALLSDIGNFAPCPDGGSVQIAVRTHAGWRTPPRLGTQEAFACRDLGAYDVPVAVVPDDTCFDGRELVSYETWLAQR